MLLVGVVFDYDVIVDWLGRAAVKLVHLDFAQRQGVDLLPQLEKSMMTMIMDDDG